MERERKGSRGHYTDRFVAVVLEEADRSGVRKAVERYGVPGSTVQYWRVHSAAEKRAAVADVARLGTAAAARQNGVCDQTIRNWRKELEGAVTGCAPGDEAPGVGRTTAAVRRARPAPPAAVEAGASARQVGKRYTPSQKAAAVAMAVSDGVSAAARTAGATPQSIYRWLEATRRTAGEPMERTWEQTEVEKQRDLEILHEWHKQPGLGPSQIRNQLRRRGIHSSTLTVRRVMVDAGYRPPKVKSQAQARVHVKAPLFFGKQPK